MKEYKKRVFTIRSFFKALFDLYKNFGSLKKAFRGKQISRSFTERIMLAVTQVNECRFCSFGHTKAALASGIAKQEIEEILKANFNNVPKEQQLALCFAQHYAENEGKYEQEYANSLIEAYGIDTTKDLLSYIEFISFGNLCGNTIDSFLARFTGHYTKGSSVLQEIIIIFSMIVLIPLIIIFGIIFR